MIWKIEKSHMVAVPKIIEAENLPELRRRVQLIANGKRNSPPIGELSYRYDLDANEQPCVVHAHFVGQNGLKRRFMKLVRIDQNADS